MTTESTSPRSMVYPSAVDWWLAILLATPTFSGTAAGVVLLRAGRPADASTMFLLAAGLTALMLVCTVPCRYTLSVDTLSLRCGLYVVRVPYDAIVSLHRASSIASGPALSMRRVAIETASGRTHLVSPRHRERFMADVQSRIPAASSDPNSDRSEAESP